MFRYLPLRIYCLQFIFNQHSRLIGACCFWLFFITLSSCNTQKHPVYGAFTLPNAHTKAPLALFNANTYDQDVTAIKLAIQNNTTNNEQDFNLIYQEIFNSVCNPPGTIYFPASSTISPSGTSVVSTWCKNASFVYTLGIDKDGSNLTSTQLNYIRTSVMGELQNAFNRYGNDDHLFGGKDWGDCQQWRSAEIVNLLCAYELMRAKNPSENFVPAQEGLSKVVRQLYKSADRPFNTLSHFLNNNLTLGTASALMMAGIILHSHSTYLDDDAGKPENWMNKGMARVNSSMFGTSEFMRMSEKGGVRGYKEGPGYFNHFMRTLLPAMVSYNSYVGGIDHTKQYKEPNFTVSVFGLFTLSLLTYPNETVENFKFDSRWLNLFHWYTGILLPDGRPPTYDDTGLGSSLPNLASLKIPDLSVLKGDNLLTSFGTTYDSRSDFLAANNPSRSGIRTSDYINPESGDFILRNTSLEGTEYYLHLLGEKHTGADRVYYKYIQDLTIPFVIAHGNFTHEHPDVGTFIISLKDKNYGIQHLAIDPPYTGFDNRSDINKDYMHNMVSIEGEFPYSYQNPDYTFYQYYPSKKLKMDIPYWEYTIGANNDYQWGRLIREIDIEEDKNYESNYSLYYVLTDRCASLFSLSPYSFKLHLNGGGNNSDGDVSFNLDSLSEGKVKYYNPCNKGRKWGLLVATSGNTGSLSYNASTHYKHGNGDKEASFITNSISPSSSYGPWGFHNNFTSIKSNISDSQCVFQTILIPYQCNDTLTGELNNIDVQNLSNTGYAASLVRNLPPDNHWNLHITSVDTSTIQIVDPFGIAPGITYESSGENSMFTYSPSAEIQSGYNCVTHTNFRKARIVKGRFLKYNDTVYIQSDKPVTAEYKINSKFNYSAYIQADSACIVKFFLPDLEPGAIMTAYVEYGVGFDSIGYDTTTFIVTLKCLPGLTMFRMDLTNPCFLACYFPSAIQTIDSLFQFRDGTYQYLGNKLDIIQPNGKLEISNGSKMSICSGLYLRNRDTLLLNGNCPVVDSLDAFSGFVNCYNPSTKSGSFTKNGVNTYESPSVINIQDGGALVLDSGSFTQVGNNSRIYVLKNGSLIIKNFASLAIGDEQTCGHAEIIAYPGSYVHIEDSAHIEFYKIVGDTFDKQIFYITTRTTPPAIAGINSSIKGLLLTDTVISSTDSAIDICTIRNVINTPWGIHNPDWGYANFAKPKAWAYLPADTICPGECMLIDLDKSLNETWKVVTICRWDTTYTPFTTIFQTCFIDTPSSTFPPPSHGDLAYCDSLKIEKKKLSFCNFAGLLNHWYEIKIHVGNDCDVEDSIILPFYTMPPMHLNFYLPDSACPGIGNVQARNLTLVSSSNAVWHVHLIDSTQYQINDTTDHSYGMDWIDTTGISYGDTFSFPGFYFKGGAKYAIALRVSNRCGDTTLWDSVVITPGALISMHHVTAYSGPILSPNSIQLVGHISNADSFMWAPTTWLSEPDSLNPIAAPEDSINYILTAYGFGCIDRDTVHIKFNTFAHAGFADTICYNEAPIILGYPYDASIFLGWLYYLGGSQFISVYDPFVTNDPNFFRYFSHYMYHTLGHMLISNCDNNNVFFQQMNKELIMKQSWFIDYYNSYLTFGDPQNAFDDFVAGIQSNTDLQNHIDTLANWSYFSSCIQDILTQYHDDFLVNLSSDISCAWYREDSTALTAYDNYFLAVDTPRYSQTYTFSVINNSIAEIDKVNIIVDTTLTSDFTGFQIDSTIYFLNSSSPVSSNTKYYWNFGDGSYSSEINPIHTFPAMDSVYIVCLEAINSCDTIIYCDTISIDSFAIIGSHIVKSTKPENYLGAVKKQWNNKLWNYPNPFNDYTIVQYEVWQDYSNLELRIVNVLGQTVFSQSLSKPTDKVQIDGTILKDGFYYYSLIVDDSIILSKTMAIIH